MMFEWDRKPPKDGDKRNKICKHCGYSITVHEKDSSCPNFNKKNDDGLGGMYQDGSREYTGRMYQDGSYERQW